MKTKYIFVTGGVISSVGKGITAASIACLLKARGLKVNILKCDPYLNINPGLLSPMQHGEVFVTIDGMEADLDLGHYERFIDQETTKFNTVTSGRIYQKVLNDEINGKFAGKTVQVVPHITNEIKNSLVKVAGDSDVVIVEIGGTVGDIEGLPFLEAIRQFKNDIGRENVLYVHVTLIPYIKASEELKTKPTQHSVQKLREIGIEPSIILCRMDQHLTDEIRDKISLFCNVERDAVIEERDVQTSIYEVPVQLHENKIDDLIVKYLKLDAKPIDLKQWNDMIHNCRCPEHQVTVAIAGKFIELKDSYKSVFEALKHGGAINITEVKIKYVDTDSQHLEHDLKDVNAIISPDGDSGGTLEGKLNVIKYARENKIPFFGISLGMQSVIIEYARNVCGIKEANSLNIDKNAKVPVIVQTNAKNKDGHFMRLGSWKCDIKKDTKAYEIYNKENISERHRHSYEVNKEYVKELEKNGLTVSGYSGDENKYVEIVEIKDHPWFVAVQFNPEFQSRPTRPHPLFANFIKAALKNKK